MVQFRFCIISTLLLVFFSTIASAQSSGTESEDVKPFEFALIGDMPYANVDFRKFDHLIKEINADQKLAWVLHAGDIKTGLSPCSDELLRDRLKRFQQFQLPFILTPGDNEWTDCHRFTAGSYQPLERLAYLRKIFYPQPGVSLGQSTMTVTTQARDPDFSEFVENVRWKKNRVIFATLHIVGSNNGLLPFSARTQADDDEVKRRINAALFWIKQTFTEARESNAHGVFLLFQANPRFELAKGNDKRLGFEEILNLLEQESVEFGKPVMLAHGDSHHFRLDKPLFSSGAGKEHIENVTRVETFGDRDIHWVRVVVDPNSPEVFTIHKQMVEKN
jgi:hypothetical protein